MAKKTEAPSRIVRDEKKRSLKCVLTRDELLEYGGKLADAQQKIAELESALASYKAQNKSESEMAKAAVENLSDKIRSKYEFRDIKCVIERNYDTGRFIVIRMDTGETVEERPLNSDELEQLPM